MSPEQQITAWTREILHLPAGSEVVVSARAGGLVVYVAGRERARFAVARLSWAQLAQALLPFGPSCSEEHS